MTAQPDVARREALTPPYRYTAELANQIEARWQDRWEAEGTFDTPNPSGPLADGRTLDPAEKFYLMDMFPYPSGAGLHVGHPLGYIGTDVYARYRRMRGDNVLHTMGFDAFGLPAEQPAIQTGQPPAENTASSRCGLTATTRVTAGGAPRGTGRTGPRAGRGSRARARPGPCRTRR